MAELNLRREDHYRVELIQKPLQIMFRNLLLMCDLEHRFVIADREIKIFLVGENFNHLNSENRDLFDRINKFIELFKKIAEEIYNFDHEELLRNRRSILSIYTRCLNEFMLKE